MNIHFLLNSIREDARGHYTLISIYIIVLLPKDRRQKRFLLHIFAYQLLEQINYLLFSCILISDKFIFFIHTNVKNLTQNIALMWQVFRNHLCNSSIPTVKWFEWFAYHDTYVLYLIVTDRFQVSCSQFSDHPTRLTISPIIFHSIYSCR